MNSKYKLIMDDICEINGTTLYRIESLRNFNDVSIGDKGGYIEREDNLSQDGYCWIYDNAKVYGEAVISNDTTVGGDMILNDNKRFISIPVCQNIVVYLNEENKYFIYSGFERLCTSYENYHIHLLEINNKDSKVANKLMCTIDAACMVLASNNGVGEGLYG